MPDILKINHHLSSLMYMLLLFFLYPYIPSLYHIISCIQINYTYLLVNNSLTHYNLVIKIF